jgi:hypothetical protein
MRRLAAVLAMLGLSACDEPTIITHVDKLDHMSVSDLWALQDGQGIPVEIHGAPFSHVTDDALAEALRPPGGSAQEVRFYAVPAGVWQGGHAWRLVLHFNPQGAPNAFHDCKLTAEVPTNPPTSLGFTVNATFCKADAWQAHGYLQALKTEDGDLEGFRNVMQALMAEVFREGPDQ